MTDALLGEGLRVLALGSGAAGHEVNVLGVAEALGAPYEMRRVEPRLAFGWTAPFGPIDPKDRASAPGSILSPPFPDVVIACGRITVPYIRAIKREGGERVFAVFLQDPRHARAEMDLIWAPVHDALRGANVMTTLTSPHPFSPARISAARAAPDPRIAALPRPRCGILLGGPSRSQHFTAADISRLREVTRAILTQGFSVMATPSRRTPPALTAAVREGLGSAPGFVWDGQGENPYLGILALAEALLVTSDSANMVGEATATGAPVHLFDPSGGETFKRAASIDALIRAGTVRRFGGALESFQYCPIDSSGEIAREIARRFVASRAPPV
jgi:mitochondrial fission protein ELM1